MKIGIIGAGEVAQSFAHKAIAAGHEIEFSNRRGPDSLSGLVEEFGPGASAATPQEAMQNDIVLLAVPWLKVRESLENLPDWNGQMLIDASNGFGEAFSKYVIPAFFNGDVDGILQRARMTQNGRLTERYAYLQDYVDGKE